MKIESEFGKGYSYCLGLFLMHTERLPRFRISNQSGNHDYGLWFNGAGDHLYEFEAKTKREKDFKNKVLAWRLSEPTEKDYKWAIAEALELLKLLDKKNEYEVIKGDYE